MNAQLESLARSLNDEIEKLEYGKSPVELYEPIRYLMGLGGKRLRPLLALMAYTMYKDDFQSVLHPAIAIEVFHNFTLMHDDIMDRAPLRRGKPTVHEKWNENIAILSGDVMLVKAYELLLKVSEHKIRPALLAFNTCAAQVCEGQQFDMNFENVTNVSEVDYLNMIKLKTAVLLGFSLELGALLADANEQSCLLLREFGTNIGIGFQLKDDLLDVYADKAKFGKQVGGDIIANKKTYLLIQAMQNATGEDQKALHYWLNLKDFDKEEKVEAVTTIYNRLGIKELAEQKMNEYFDKGFLCLEKLEVSKEKKQYLEEFAKSLINREK
jgi:geranylgeranyl diphosphate synthase, type II